MRAIIVRVVSCLLILPVASCSHRNAPRQEIEPSHQADCAHGQASAELVLYSIRYLIPCAYLPLGPIGAGTPIATVFPGFGPADPDSRRFPSGVRNADGSYQFVFRPSGGLSADEMRTNSLRNRDPSVFQEATDEFGYRYSWSRNVPDFRTYWRGKGPKAVFFTCGMVLSSAAERGFCSDHHQLPDGNGVWFYFPFDMRGDLPQMEAGLDRLMLSFHADPKPDRHAR